MQTLHLINVILLGVLVLLSVATLLVAFNPNQEYKMDPDEVGRVVGIAGWSVIMVWLAHGWWQAPVSVALLILAFFTYAFLDHDVRALRDRKKRVAAAWATIRAGREARERAVANTDEATETD